MYIDESKVEGKGKSYTRYLLRESYRDKGKVKKRTIANLSACSEPEITAIKLALKHKKNLHELISIDDVSLEQKTSFGAVWTVYQTACRLGITDALGHSRQGKLALWQVIARVIDQGSRLSAVRFASNHSACDILNCDTFNEDHLYKNLDWLAEKQEIIEKKLFNNIVNKEESELFLYDVTSSYVEGECNELAAFGYNRDGKRGKKQIVIGLLCNSKGDPLSIEVFPGNTSDTKTFGQQVSKVAQRFGGKSVTFVGDRGMIKGPQIKMLQEENSHEFHYITAINKAQIEMLLKEKQLQMDLFDDELAEVESDDGQRFVFRRNPIRAEEIRESRQDKLETMIMFVQKQNQYLNDHKKASPEVAKRKVGEKAKKMKIDSWVRINLSERVLTLLIDQEKLHELEKLDGCYVLKTDLPSEKVSKDIIHRRYKDLSLVEWAFRTSKTVQLEMRPIHVRLEMRTRGHALVVMLAYKIIKELSKLWNSINLTVQEALAELEQLCAIKVQITGHASFQSIPKPQKSSQELFDLAKVKLPTVLPDRGIRVVTRKMLASRRKST